MGALLAAALELPEAAPLGVDPAAVIAVAGSTGASLPNVAVSGISAGSDRDGAAVMQQLESGCDLSSYHR